IYLTHISALLSHVFYAVLVIFAILVITNVQSLGTRLPTHPTQANVRIAQRSNRSGLPFLNIRGHHVGSYQMADFYTVFTEPLRIARENIFINHIAPQKEFGFVVPSIHQLIYWNLQSNCESAFWGNNSFCFIGSEWEIESLTQFLKFRLNRTLKYCRFCGSISGIYPVQINFLRDPMARRIETWAQYKTLEVHECPLRTPCSLAVGVGYLPHLDSEKRKDSSKYSSPHRGFISEQKIPNFFRHLYIGLKIFIFVVLFVF